MSNRFDARPRFSAAGVTTAAILVVIVAMGVSTLRPSEAPQSAVAANSSSAQVAQAHNHKPVRKS
jgi:hypothetical protein